MLSAKPIDGALDLAFEVFAERPSNTLAEQSEHEVAHACNKIGLKSQRQTRQSQHEPDNRESGEDNADPLRQSGVDRQPMQLVCDADFALLQLGLADAQPAEVFQLREFIARADNRFGNGLATQRQLRLIDELLAAMATLRQLLSVLSQPTHPATDALKLSTALCDAGRPEMPDGHLPQPVHAPVRTEFLEPRIELLFQTDRVLLRLL